MMLSPASQVLVRNKDFFETGKWLIANPTEGAIFKQLGTGSVFGFHQYHDVFQDACRIDNSDNHRFTPDYQAAADFDGAVLYMPKSKPQANMLLANLAALIKPGGQILLVGENKSGIKSAAKLLTPFSDQVNKIDSARHCSLICAQIGKTAAPFKLSEWQSSFCVNVKNIELKLTSLPGVFSHGELDVGTGLLLENITRVPNGKVLDFACGSGIIGCFIAKQNSDIKLTMCDVSALALHCAAKTAALNNVNADIVASDGLTQIDDKYAAVYTNPPFHTGVQTDYSVTEGFISGLKQSLLPKGELTLVANRFLKYPQALEDSVGKVNVLAKTSKFSVYHCKR